MQSAAKLSNYKNETSALHRRMIERVILTIHERLGEVFSLDEMAEVAMISPYHFNRIFRQITGIPPVQFQGAVRLQAAKRLLLTTESKVIDICFEVGYNSLGTFTRRFTELVGLSPCRLRQLGGSFHSSQVGNLYDFMGRLNASHPASFDAGVAGCINAPANFAGMIFVGLFPARIPQGRPIRCAILTKAGPYRIAAVPDGSYHAFAVAFDWSADALAYLLHDNALRGASGSRAIVVRNGQVSGRADITLQPAQLTDPPILIALPFLLLESLTERGSAVV